MRFIIHRYLSDSKILTLITLQLPPAHFYLAKADPPPLLELSSSRSEQTPDRPAAASLAASCRSAHGHLDLTVGEIVSPLLVRDQISRVSYLIKTENIIAMISLKLYCRT